MPVICGAVQPDGGSLGADGWTRVSECEHIERGYEDICRDLRALGAEIRAGRMMEIEKIQIEKKTEEKVWRAVEKTYLDHGGSTSCGSRVFCRSVAASD